MCKRLLGICLLLLTSCSNNNTSPPSVTDGGDSSVFTIKDSGRDTGSIITPDIDSAPPSYYDPCVTATQVATQYSRLMQNVCVDSNNNSYVESYFDTQLQIKCNWKLSSDFNVRCLPLSEQTPQYADDTCTTKIALAATDLSGKPTVKYIGLYTLIKNIDAGSIDAGGYSRYMDIYPVGIK
jgi:hypothetical protein